MQLQHVPYLCLRHEIHQHQATASRPGSAPPGLIPYDAKPHPVWRYTPIRAASQGTDVTSCPLLPLLFLLLASTASTTPFVGHSLLVVDILLAPESSNWRSIGELGKSAQPWYPTSVSLLSYLITCPSTDCFQYISDCLYRVQPGLLILNLTGRAFIHAIYTSCMAVVSPICECI